MAAFAECWNRGQFFAAHEILEVRWIREKDSGLQGLIQLAAAMHHLSNGNLRGAKTMFERALARLRGARKVPGNVEMSGLVRYAQQAQATIERMPAADVIAARPKL